MSLEILKKELKEGILRPVYLLFGPEEYLVSHYLNELEKKIVVPEFRGFNHQVLEGKTGAEKIIDACETLPMMSERKMVVAKETGLFGAESKGKKDKTDVGMQSAISEYLAQKSKEVSLIFVENEVNKKNKLYRTIEEKGLCIEFGYQGEQELSRWAAKIFSTHEIKINRNDAEYLVNCCNPGMTDILNEINKLIDFVGDGNTVNKENIETICSKSLQGKVFDMIDAITRKDPSKAYELLNDMLVLKEPIQKISVLVARHFKNLLYVKQMRSKGYTPEKIAKLTNLQSFAVNKYIRHSGAFNLDELQRAMNDCLEMDIKVKTGRIDPRLALETFIAAYAG